VTSENLHVALRRHIEQQWPGREKVEFVWEKGPIEHSVPGFRVCRISPKDPSDPWIYVSLGASALPAAEGERFEFFVLSPVESPIHVETLAMVTNFHSDARYRLAEGRIVRIGRSWVEGSRADHLMVSLPYPFGPAFERCAVDDLVVRFLWLVPVTEAEAKHAREHGHAALEELLERVSVNTVDPLRPSVV
jgi:suppressor of fused protein SUFU